MALTNEAIDGMEAGPDLNKLVGKEVIGCRVVHCRKGTYKLVIPGSFDRIDFVEAEGAWDAMPPYSTDIAAAWPVVEKMGSKSTPLMVWNAFGRSMRYGWIRPAKEVALAICRAALKAGGYKPQGGEK